MYYGEVTWLGIIIFFIIVIIERRREKKRKDWTVPDEMKRDVDEEVGKVKKMVADTKAEWKEKGWIE